MSKESAMSPRSATAAGDVLTTRSPVTGQVVGTYPVMRPAEIAAALGRARTAARWWRDLGFEERRRRLLAVRAAIARRAREIAALMHAETAKPEAVGFTEVLIAGEHLGFAARRARAVLGHRRVPSTLATFTQASSLCYEPLGVVAVISPWNYPLAIPAADLASVVGAGNAALVKPSEYATATAEWIVARFAEAIPEHPVVQLVPGDGETGAALVRAGVDKVAFTGSVEVGRKIAAACAETLTPVSLELGGKDPLIVASDADLDSAVEGAVFGGFLNAGQTCISIERAYVVEDRYEQFVDLLVERLRGLRCETTAGAALGPLALPRQVEIVRAHVSDALARGARALLGGLEAIDPPRIDPIVLVDVPASARIMREETFGPVLPVVRVADTDEAVRRANDSDFGLGAAVYSRRHGMEIAARLRAGAVGVNSVMWFYASPHLPFGGAGQSGLGLTHGPDGLRNFTVPKAITRRRIDLGSFGFDRLPLHARVHGALPLVARLLHGRAPRSSSST
jgi:acyl-CoA reductase-like NAD-dependent aldehyde dehydrogenase